MEHFDEVFQTYFSDVYLYLRSLCGDASLAEELTSETFFKALGAIDRFRGECSIRVWLCQIAKNAYFTYRKKHPDTLQLPPQPDTQPSPEARLIRAQDTQHLHALIHALPEPYREVFTLRVFGELRFAYIAALFGKTANWACVTYHRARAKILAEMEEASHD